MENLAQASDLRRGSAFLCSLVLFAHISRGPAACRPVGAGHTVMMGHPVLPQGIRDTWAGPTGPLGGPEL